MLGSILSLQAKQEISAASLRNDITIEGAHHVTLSDGALTFSRFSDDISSLKPKEIGFNLMKSRTTSGVRLFFKTESPMLTMQFTINPKDANRGSDFGVFIDGKFYKSYKFPQTTKNLLSFTINPGSRKMREYEITLPSFSNPKLKSLTLEDGSRLEKVDRSNKKVYVAIGDSITHGVGQDSATHLTYTYLLANKLDMKYYNFAVGGGKISIPVGRQLKDIKKIDLITILIGYNDWVFDGKTPTTYTAKYRKLIEAIRVNHPETEIHCITLLYTRNTKSRKTGTTYQPADYRNALISLVKELQTEGDKHIHLIKGDSITSEKNLRGPAMPKDMVHLGIKGAAMFAEELAKIIQPQLEKKQ